MRVDRTMLCRILVMGNTSVANSSNVFKIGARAFHYVIQLRCLLLCLMFFHAL